MADNQGAIHSDNQGAGHITVTHDGPYQVTGAVPIHEEIITPVHRHNELRLGRELPQAATYFLCRCGGSGHAPFCDGTHLKRHFDGTEVADMRPYAERIADTVEGTTMTLLDDDRCAFARFCHRERGDVWTLTEHDRDPENRAEALVGVHECPAGRLVEVDDSGTPIEPPFAPEIVVLQDPAEQVSGPLWVKGPVAMTSATGAAYEVRNRMALCRCGASGDKPFCDATHVRKGYRDSSVAAEYSEPRLRPTGFTAHTKPSA